MLLDKRIVRIVIEGIAEYVRRQSKYFVFGIAAIVGIKTIHIGTEHQSSIISLFGITIVILGLSYLIE